MAIEVVTGAYTQLTIAMPATLSGASAIGAELRAAGTAAPSLSWATSQVTASGLFGKVAVASGNTLSAGWYELRGWVDRGNGPQYSSPYAVVCVDWVGPTDGSAVLPAE